jgi:hypothetical protein
MEKTLKYYTIYIIGQPILDANKKPTMAVVPTGNTDADRKLAARIAAAEGYDIKWQLTGRDNPAMRAIMNNYDPRYYQAEMVEENIEKDTVTSSSGKAFKVGKMSVRGKVINIFATRHREIFKAVTEEIANSNFTLVIPPSADGKIRPVCRINEYVQPGWHVQFKVPFRFEVWFRDGNTHAEVQQFQSKYNSKGVLERKPWASNIGDIFLFPNEIEAVEAHIETATLALMEHKLAEDLSGNTRTDDVKNVAATVNDAGKDDSAGPDL